MNRSTRMLVLGASGMIGRAVQQEARGVDFLELLSASHQDKPGYVRVDYESLVTAVDWIKVLHELRVDAVVNCIGIWSGTLEKFERIQYMVPVALFNACASLDIRVVHISALGFAPDSPLPYASTKARADHYLREHCPTGVVLCPSLVFGSDGDSTKFFLNLAALPLQVDFRFAANLQPVHVREVARAVVEALTKDEPDRVVECAGTHPISIPEYFAALRKGMGLRPVRLTLKLPRWCGRLLFNVGELLGAHFVNHQTWVLLQSGTQSSRNQPNAIPYDEFATPQDRQMVQRTQLYWFARLSTAILWLWTAAVTLFAWPKPETLSWLDALWPGLGTPSWLTASCALDTLMGVLALFRPSRRLWQVQLALTAVYSLGLAVALPWSWSHPFGPLTKNLAVAFAMVCLVMWEPRRRN